MKEQNIIRMKCITILLFIILSVVLIVVGFSQEYRSSSLFSGGVGGLIVSLYMLKTIWSAKASQRKREQLIIDETDERNLLIQKNSRAQAFNVSLIATLAGTGYELLSAMDTNRYLSSAASVIPVYHDRLPRTQICKAGIYKTISPYRLPSVCISSDQYAFHLSHNHLFCTGICYLLSKCKSSGSGYAHGG